MKKIFFVICLFLTISTVSAKRVELTFDFDYNDTFNILNEIKNTTPFANYLILHGLNLTDDVYKAMDRNTGVSLGYGAQPSLAINTVDDNWLLNFCSDDVTDNCVTVPQNAKYMFIVYFINGSWNGMPITTEVDPFTMQTKYVLNNFKNLLSQSSAVIFMDDELNFIKDSKVMNLSDKLKTDKLVIAKSNKDSSFENLKGSADLFNFFYHVSNDSWHIEDYMETKTAIDDVILNKVIYDGETYHNDTLNNWWSNFWDWSKKNFLDFEGIPITYYNEHPIVSRGDVYTSLFDLFLHDRNIGLEDFSTVSLNGYSNGFFLSPYDGDSNKCRSLADKSIHFYSKSEQATVRLTHIDITDTSKPSYLWSTIMWMPKPYEYESFQPYYASEYKVNEELYSFDPNTYNWILHVRNYHYEDEVIMYYNPECYKLDGLNANSTTYSYYDKATRGYKTMSKDDFNKIDDDSNERMKLFYNIDENGNNSEGEDWGNAVGDNPQQNGFDWNMSNMTDTLKSFIDTTNVISNMLIEFFKSMPSIFTTALTSAFIIIVIGIVLKMLL